MKTRYFFITLILLLFRLNVTGQEVDMLVSKGVELHEQGQFQQAIQVYQQALEHNADSPLIHYQIALSYFYGSDFEQAAFHSRFVIDKNDTSHLEGAYVVCASSLDLMDKPQSAIQLYREALGIFPKSFLLHYNLAYTALGIGDNKLAVNSLEKALMINHFHPGSHNLLGQIYFNGVPAKSIMAFSFYLLTSPQAKNAKSIFDLLVHQLEGGKNLATDRLLSTDIKYKDHDTWFELSEKVITMIQENMETEKSGIALFTENLNAFFIMMGELRSEETKGFWWDFYVDFYHELVLSGHGEAFAYYISQAAHDDQAKFWMIENEERLQYMVSWIDRYLKSKKQG
jgi:TPR repeat protein